ncbi:MAG: hypothetical protein HRU07_01265 [Nitrosopumilus sp.]|nr:hypothetical protein [Nitrosopumilus sp.]NRA04803.1 hypothetical protein [Nitrosopumilus sp.]
MTFQEQFLESAKSDSRKKSKTQIKIKNPLEKDIFVNAISLVADVYFSLKGRCEIKINNNVEFTPKDNAFKLRKEILIPLENQILKQNGSIDISIWNPVDDDVVELSALVIISEHSGNVTISGQAVDDSTMLKGISGGAGNEADTHDIFPYQIYRDETKEFLINTKGRENMLLTMASSNVLAPKIINHNFTPETKSNPFQFKINSSVDNTPDSTSGVSRIYASAGPVRNRNWSTQTEAEWYYVTEYLNTLRDVTLSDNKILDDATYGEFVDKYLLIDGQGIADKELKFDFDSTGFSQDVTSGVMAVTLTKIIKYQRTQTAKYVPAAGGTFFTRKVVVTPWTAYTPVSTSYSYKSATVTLRSKITFEIEVSDDVNFAIFRKIKDVTSNGTLTVTFSEKYMRIKRIVTGEKLIVNYGSSGGVSTADLSYPDITSDYSVSNLIDLESHGGTASLSFLLKGVNDQWFTLLKSSELDAVTQGESKLIRHDIAGIPPSQSRFKAVLQVTGSLKTGVTIDLVA